MTPLENRSRYPRRSGSLPLALLILPCLGSAAEPEIYRCTQEDGTVAFQEMPCPDLADQSDANDTAGDVPAPAVEDPFDFVNPFDAAAEPSEAPARTDSRPIPGDREACIKDTRDAIDAIDLEMRKGYSKEQGEAYLAELLELTRQLRACKQG